MTKPYSLIALLLIGISLFAGCSDDSTNNILPPAAPSDLIAYGLSSFSIRLYWTDNSNNETSFIIYRSQGDTFIRVGNASANTVEFTDVFLDDTTEYAYYVAAINGAGSTPSTDTVRATTRASGQPPVVPYDPTPADSINGQDLNVDLAWITFDPDNDRLKFDVYFGTSPEAPLVVSDRYFYWYELPLLEYGTTYYWRVVAKDTSGHAVSSPLWHFRTLREVTFIGNFDVQAVDVKVRGNYAYDVTNMGIYIFDISNPNEPVRVGMLAAGDYTHDILLNGNYGYLSATGRGMIVVDLTNPAAPESVGCYDSPGWVYSTYIDGNRAYLADYASDVEVLDITDPTSPVFLGNIESPGYVYDVVADGNYLYVADSYSGLRTFDISDLAHPVYLANVEGGSRAIVKRGQYVFLSGIGLKIVDVSDPARPQVVSAVQTRDESWDIALSGNYAYLATYSAGLEIVDITDLSAPRIDAYFDTPGAAIAVCFDENYIYVAAWNFGVQILQYRP